MLLYGKPYLIGAEKRNFGITKYIHRTNGFSGSTPNMQDAKLRCCLQTTDKNGLSFSDFKDQCSLQVLIPTFNRSGPGITMSP